EEPSSDGVPHDPGPAPLPIALPEPVHASEAASAQPPAASERPTHSTPSVGEEAEPVAPPRATEPSESTPAQSDESGTERATKGAGATVQSDGLAVGDAQAIAKRSGAAVKGAGAMAPNNEGGIEGTEDNGDSDDIAVKDAEATPKNDEGGTAGTEDNDGKTSTGRTVGGSPPLFPGRWIVAASVVLLGCGTAAAVVLTTRPPPEPPAWTLEIKAHPEHAEVEVDGQPRGVTPTRVERLPGGRTVQLLIKHDGYEPHVRNLALDAEHGGTIPVNVKLEPRKRLGQVRLDVLPKDAQVVLEGNPIPASPNNPGLYRIAREPGEVQVEVTAAHHFPRSETVEVPSNGGVLRHTLQLIPHPVRVEVVSAGRATRGKVTVEAGDRFTSHCGLPCSLKVPYPGPISVEARVDGREPWRATRTGRAGAVVRFEVPAPAPPRREAEARLRGTLSRLREDGEREAAGFGEVNLSRAPSGFRRAALKGGPNVTLRYAYDANTRRVKFTLGSDPWSQVTFDGSPAGQTPLVNRWISSGRHTIWLVNHNAVVHLNFHHP
ncbi:MAG: PEGA domain-containing protein, partial [Myxococcota bacterium]